MIEKHLSTLWSDFLRWFAMMVESWWRQEATLHVFPSLTQWLYCCWYFDLFQLICLIDPNTGCKLHGISPLSCLHSHSWEHLASLHVPLRWRVLWVLCLLMSFETSFLLQFLAASTWPLISPLDTVNMFYSHWLIKKLFWPMAGQNITREEN